MIFVHFFIAVVLFKALGEAATRPGIPTSAAVMLAITSAASGFAAQFLAIPATSRWVARQVTQHGRIREYPVAPLLLPYGAAFALSLAVAWGIMLGFAPRLWDWLLWPSEQLLVAGFCFALPLALHFVVSSFMLKHNSDQSQNW